MKKEYVYLIFILILFSQFFSVFATSSSDSIPKTGLTQINDPKSITEIQTQENVGDLLGFSNPREVELENALITKNGNRVEITLKQGGKMIFNGETNLKYSGFNSDSIDVSKKNKFVFENGELIEAEFNTNSPLSGTKYNYIISGINFDSPSSSKLTFKENLVTITPSKNPGIVLNNPLVGSNFEPNENNRFKFNYVAPLDGSGLEIGGPGGMIIPLKEGTVSFVDQNRGELIFLGDKVVLEKTSAVPFDSEQTYLDGITFKNSDPLRGTSFFYGKRTDLSSDDGPYINIETLWSYSRDITACAPCITPTQAVGYNVLISPDKFGNSPDVTFSSGNIIFPGMSDTQSLVFQPGSSKLHISTNFNSIDNSNSYGVSTTITVYSKDAKIINSGNTYQLKEENGKSQWYTNRISESSSSYPMKLTSAEKTGSLTVYSDSLVIGGNAFFTRESSSFDPDYTYSENTLSASRSSLDSVKKKTIDSISNMVESVFGFEAGDKAYDYLSNLLGYKRRRSIAV